MNKTRAVIAVAGLILMSGAAFAVSAIWQPKAEREFLAAAAAQVEDGASVLQLSDILDGPWDRLCMVSVDESSLPGLNPVSLSGLLGVDLSTLDGRVPPVMYATGSHIVPRPMPRLIVFLISGRRIEDVLSFKRPFVVKDKQRIPIGLSDNKEACVDRSRALLRLSSTNWGGHSLQLALEGSE